MTGPASPSGWVRAGNFPAGPGTKNSGNTLLEKYEHSLVRPLAPVPGCTGQMGLVLNPVYKKRLYHLANTMYNQEFL